MTSLADRWDLFTDGEKSIIHKALEQRHGRIDRALVPFYNTDEVYLALEYYMIISNMRSYTFWYLKIFEIKMTSKWPRLRMMIHRFVGYL